jgi:hypothetical protein
MVGKIFGTDGQPVRKLNSAEFQFRRRSGILAWTKIEWPVEFSKSKPIRVVPGRSQSTTVAEC